MSDTPTAPTTPAIPDTSQAYEVKEKLARLENLLLERAPGLPTLLRDIHKQLKADPDVVTILTEDECNILVRGLLEQTKTTIATAVIKRKPKKAMKDMQVGLDL